MRYLSLSEVLELHHSIIQQSGGSPGVLSLHVLESALAQPMATFGSQEMYPTLVEKAAALAFSLIRNHAFLDGNKRVGHAAMEVFLLLNGFEIDAAVDEQEQIVLQVAAGKTSRAELTSWLHEHVIPVRQTGEEQ